MTKIATTPSTADVFENLQKLQQQNKRQGNIPLTFEALKPIIIGTMQGKSVYQLWQEDKNVPYSTLRVHKKAALEFINPANTKRTLSASDEAWLLETYKLYMPA